MRSAHACEDKELRSRIGSRPPSAGPQAKRRLCELAGRIARQLTGSAISLRPSHRSPTMIPAHPDRSAPLLVSVSVSPAPKEPNQK
jgi:hypothetical protein